MGDSLPSAANKSNKIRDIVRLHQMLRKWKKTATATSKTATATTTTTTTTTTTATTTTTNTKTTTKTINKLLKKTLSFSDITTTPHQNQNQNQNHNHNHNHNQHHNTTTNNNVVPKGYLAVWVGRDQELMKKFVIPTDYLAHQAFALLLREAEEEFGFQQEGILHIPCDVPLFENILKMMPDTKKRSSLKSSSSTSSFFLYEQQSRQVQQQEGLVNFCSPADHHQSFGTHAQLITHPATATATATTPSYHLQLYCR